MAQDMGCCRPGNISYNINIRSRQKLSLVSRNHAKSSTRNALVKNRKNHKTTLAQYISFKIIGFKIILFKREYNSSFWGSLCLACFLRKQTQKRNVPFTELSDLSFRF